MTLKKRVYLDYAAATPLDPKIRKAMEPYLSEKFYNPAATYKEAREVRGVIAESKKTLGGITGVKPTEIIFTSGGTEANNLAIFGVMSRFPDKNLLISSVEHDSILDPAKRWNYHELDVNFQGRIDPENLIKKINDQTVLVSIILANNEVGTTQPISALANIVKEVRKDRKDRKISVPLYLHTDACQAPLYLDIHPKRLGVDMMTLNGGKIYGPKQSGLLFVKTGIELQPILLGGNQQRGLRSGTEGAASVVGLTKAISLAQKNRSNESKRLAGLQSFFMSELGKKFPSSIINGSKIHRLPNNISVTFKGADNERLINNLDQAGIMVAAGSACSASSEEPSHVLGAMGISEKDARSTIRLTMGAFTTKADIKYVLDKLVATLA